MQSRLARFAPTCAMLVAVARVGGAQCAAFKSGFEASGVGGSVSAQVEFDDGSGPAPYVGGYFSSAGGRPSRGIA